jgi:hypothetical protein
VQAAGATVRSLCMTAPLPWRCLRRVRPVYRLKRGGTLAVADVFSLLRDGVGATRLSTSPAIYT